jgi:hypothetical protein
MQVGVWARPHLGRFGGRAGAGQRAYNPYRRPASMPEIPFPYPEDTRDVEDVDGM